MPGDGGPGRHNSPLNPDGTDEAGPGRGRRTIDPGQFSGPVDRGRPASGSPLPGRPVSGSPTSGGPAGPVSAVPMSGNAPAVPTPTSPAEPRRGAGPTPPPNVPGRAAAPAPGPGHPPAGRTGGGRHATGEFTPVSPRDYTGPPSRPAGRRAAPDPDDSQELYGSRGGSGYTPRRGSDESPDQPTAEAPTIRNRPAAAPAGRVGHAGARRNVLGSRNTGTTGRARPGDALDEGTGRHSVLGPGSRTGPVSASPVSGSPAPARAPALIHLASTPGPSRRARAVVRSPLVLFRPASTAGPSLLVSTRDPSRPARAVARFPLVLFRRASMAGRFPLVSTPGLSRLVSTPVRWGAGSVRGRTVRPVVPRALSTPVR